MPVPVPVPMFITLFGPAHMAPSSRAAMGLPPPPPPLLGTTTALPGWMTFPGPPRTGDLGRSASTSASAPFVRAGFERVLWIGRTGCHGHDGMAALQPRTHGGLPLVLVPALGMVDAERGRSHHRRAARGETRLHDGHVSFLTVAEHADPPVRGRRTRGAAGQDRSSRRACTLGCLRIGSVGSPSQRVTSVSAVGDGRASSFFFSGVRWLRHGERRKGEMGNAY